MATPLKNLSAILSPRLIKNTFSPKPQLARSTEVLKTKTESVSISGARRSLFAVEEGKKSNQLLPPKLLLPQSVPSKHPVFLINTPNKNCILKNGLENKPVDVLGKGTFGTVFKGKLKDTEVAIKLVSSENVENEKNALGLSHENLVRTFDIILKPHTRHAMILMEHLPDCNDLQHLLNTENISDRIYKFSIDICKGLEYLHKQEILHLDLKPKNILVVSKSICKICDFGNSVRVCEEVGNFKNQGTVPYTAPELLQGMSPTEKCDIYSLGIILWQLKYRINPYEGIRSNEEIIYKVVKFQMRPPCEGAFDSYTNIFIKCWSAEPKDRPSAKEVLKFLLEL